MKQIGDKALGGWTVESLGEECPYHPGHYILKAINLKILPKRHVRTGCDECHKEIKNKHNRHYRKRNFLAGNREKGIYISCLSLTEGSDEITWWWSEKVDQKIKDFWAKRGMTEEDGQVKWGSPSAWRRIMRQRASRSRLIL